MPQQLSAEVNINVDKAKQGLSDLANSTKIAGDKIANNLGKGSAEAISRLDKLGASIKRLQAIAQQAGPGTQKFNIALKAIANREREIAAINKFNSSLASIAPRAQSTGAAMTNLTRIVQDAPFGFIAIQNNVTEAIHSFNQLKASTGSTGAALKALASSFTGAGGLLFAFSAVTSITTALIQKYGSLGEAWKVLTGQARALSDEQKKIAEDQRESAIAIEKQRIETEQLVKVARGDIGSKAEQKAALDQLNKAIPDYIGVLTQANIKTAEGAKIIDAYTSALIKQATAELLVKRAAELTVKQYDAENEAKRKLIPLFEKQSKLQKDIVSLRKSEANQVGGSTLGIGTGGGSAQAEENLRKTQAEIKAILDTLGKGTADITKELNKLQSEIDKNTVVIDPVGDDKGKTKFNAKDYIEEIKKQLEFELESSDKIRFSPEITVLPSGIEIQTGEVAKLNQFVQQSINTSLAARPLEVNPPVLVKPIIEDRELENLNSRIQSILATGISSAAAGIGESIGKSIAEGTNVLEALTSSFMQAFAGLIESIGKALIEYGIVKAGLDKIILGGISIPGVAIIAAGAAAVAVANLVKTAVPTKFAEGGIITGPTLGLVGEGGQPEVILPLSKINQFLDDRGSSGGELTTRVSGDDLLFIMNRATRRQNRNF